MSATIIKPSADAVVARMYGTAAEFCAPAPAVARILVEQTGEAFGVPRLRELAEASPYLFNDFFAVAHTLAAYDFTRQVFARAGGTEVPDDEVADHLRAHADGTDDGSWETWARSITMRWHWEPVR